MDGLDQLSDDELRRRLLQYGFPNLPITDTTRKTLIKKLRNYIKTESSRLRHSTSNAAKYSSAEESDNTDTGGSSTSIGRSRAKRITVSGAPTSVGSFKTPTSPQNYEMLPPKTSFTSARNSLKSSPSQLAGKSSGKKSSIYVSPVIINDSEDDDLEFSLRRNLTAGNSFNLTSGSSRVSLGGGDGSYYDSSLRNGNGNDENENEEEEDGNSTSYYTRRLLQFRNDQKSIRRRPTSHLMPRSEPMNENDIVYHAEPSLEPAQIPLNIAIRNFINRLDEYYGLRQTFVPYTLLFSLILFLIVIMCFYVTMSPDIQNTISPETTIYEKCDLEHESGASYSCIEENHLHSSLSLLKRIGQELQSRALAKSCDQETSISMMYCVKDIVKPSDLLQLKDVHNCEYLIDHNPHWGIQNVDIAGNTLSLDQILHKRADHENCFTIKNPKLPLKCVIYSKMQTFFLIVGFLGIVGILGYLGNLFYKFVVQVKEKRRELVQKLINDVINSLLEKTMIDKENPVVIITHLRDKLIDPMKRKEQEWAWMEAIKYLEKNDSRITFEVKNINGEDFKVMRWIDETKSQAQSVIPSSSPVSSPQIPNVYNGGANNRLLKKWIGPAFDKTNKIKDPPTQCLKIRQMFDKYDTNDQNLQQVIQDAILTKLNGKNCRILDIQLDLKTCCVYVKCESNTDAGIVHDNINGQWFDNRLVSIKFLRLERYTQRFPNSANLTSCLRPSPAALAAMSQAPPLEYMNNHASLDFDDNDDEYDEDDDN